jgi:hypothetical protein
MNRIFVSGSARGGGRGAARALAAIAGTLPVALLLSLALMLILPAPMTLGLRIGGCALLPIWWAAAGCTLVAARARDAWFSLLCLSALAAALSGSVLALEHALRPATAVVGARH